MSTWRRRFTRKSQKPTENEGNVLTNATKYRKKLQAAVGQISRTKKSVQRHLDSPDSVIHVARLVNDIGQLSDCRPLQEISGFIDSLAMRQQLSSRIFNEYAMNSLEQSLQKLNENLSDDFERSKSVYEEANNNHCSDHTKRQLLNKVHAEWLQHQKLATKELKHGLSSYCDVGLYNLKIQTAMLEKLQSFVDRLPHDDSDANTGLPEFASQSLEARRDIDTMLRIMLDAAPTDPASLPNVKRPKLFSNQLTLSNTLYSSEISEAAAARSQGQSLRQQNIPQYPTIHSTAAAAAASAAQRPEHESMMVTPSALNNDQPPNEDSLPSYTDLFVVPATCKDAHPQRRSARQHHH